MHHLIVLNGHNYIQTNKAQTEGGRRSMSVTSAVTSLALAPGQHTFFSEVTSRGA